MKKEKLDIVYEDKYLIIINKKHNLLTVATDKEKDKTLFHQLLTFQKQKNKNNKIFIIHRLDKDTSGLVMFAKDEKTKRIMQDNWDELVSTRGYIGIVDGITEKKGTIKSWLKETKTFLTYSSVRPNDGKLAITNYKRVLTSKRYSLLDINIETGRKNQIRVQLNDIGFPIIGDKKYGKSISPIRRLGLHAYLLEFSHPITKEKIKIETDIPNNFLSLFEINH